MELVYGLWYISEDKITSLACTFVTYIMEGLRSNYNSCHILDVYDNSQPEFCGLRFDSYLKKKTYFVG